MKTGELKTKNKLSTPGSGTTVYIDYSEEKKVLEVGFDGGKVYHYLEVEQSVWMKYKSLILKGESSGVFVNTQIKPVYQYIEIH
ncbi:MAG TPA: KTSC domain-containing protein [Pedobacter sp.]|jgi:hypothetical protein